MGAEEFENMNYRDLQKLAKTAGVKANLPKAELVKALQENAMDNSMDTSEGESATPSRAEASQKLNSTFDKEDMTTSSILNTTFEKDEQGEVRRASKRLSVGKLRLEAVEQETKNSPKPRKSGNNTPSNTPADKTIARVEYIRKETPRTSGGKIAKTPRSALSDKPKVNTTEKVKLLVRQISTPSSVKKVLSIKKTPLVLAKSTPKAGSLKKATPASVSTKEHKRTPLVIAKSTPKAGSIKKATPGSARNVATKTAGSSTNIPRFVKFARKVPDFSKIHEKEFKKMESLDTYLDKKKKRTEAAEEQFKKAKTLKEEHNKIMERVKARTPAAKFVPAVTSTSKMNLNFGSQTPAAAVFKFSAAPAVVSNKKPGRAQMGVKEMTKEKPTVKPVAATPKTTVARTPVSKPFHNITNKSMTKTPSSTKKTFDLKASLAKPLGYKPHLGKLPTWGDKKKATESGSLTNREMLEKTRNIIRGVRMNKRAALLLQNRNITE